MCEKEPVYTQYACWEMTLPNLPPRSRLYHLEPLGVGTAEVESLTGYVARLADAHCVTVRRLLTQQVLPKWERPHLSKKTDSSLSAFLAKGARPLNGMGVLAQDGVEVLSQLTGRADLIHLTLLNWRAVFSTRGLLRDCRVWCPSCYQAWREAGQIVYEPYIWLLRAVTHCPMHHCRLRTRCHHADCQANLPLLASKMRPGYCSRCQRWLGEQVMLMDDQQDAAQLRRQQWIADQLGRLLATSATFSEPAAQENVAAAMSAYRRCRYGDSVAAIARDLTISVAALHNWCAGRQIPQLSYLLRVCDRLGISLVDICLGTTDVMNAARLRSPRFIPCEQPMRQKRCAFDAARIRQALEAVLVSEEMPPPPMREVAKRLGYAHATLHNRFPALCKAISARYLADRREASQQRMAQVFAEVRAGVAAVHAQGVYPSVYRITPYLSKPGYAMHPAVQAVWREEMRVLGWL